MPIAVWSLGLLLVVALVLYGATQTFKKWFYGRLGPQRFAGRDTDHAKQQRGVLIGTVVLAAVVPISMWLAMEEWRLQLSLLRTTGRVHEVSVVQA